MTDPASIDLRNLVRAAFHGQDVEHLEHAEHIGGTPEKTININDFNGGTPEHLEHRENGLKDISIADEWRTGLALLSLDRVPCPGIVDWPATHAAAWQFVERFGEEARSLGWSTLDLWGVHPLVGAVRSDARGAAIMSKPVTAVRADRIVLGNLSFRRHPSPPPRIPIWEFRWPSPKGISR